MATFLLPLPEAEGNFFLIIHCENLVELLQLKLIKVGALYVWVSPRVLTLSLVLTGLAAIDQLQFRISYHATASQEVFCL